MKVTTRPRTAAEIRTATVVAVVVATAMVRQLISKYLETGLIHFTDNVSSRIVDTASADLSNLKEAVVDKTRKVRLAH